MGAKGLCRSSNIAISSQACALSGMAADMARAKSGLSWPGVANDALSLKRKSANGPEMTFVTRFGSREPKFAVPHKTAALLPR